MIYFFKQYNGVSLLPEPFWVADPLDFSVDACDTGCAGFYFGSHFHVELAPDFISTLETHYFKRAFCCFINLCTVERIFCMQTSCHQL